MKFETRHASHPSIIPTLNSSKMREMYHISGIFIPDDVSLTFSHIERMINGGVMPVNKAIELSEVPALNKGPFLARRELGVINVGGNGKVSVDGKEWALVGPRRPVHPPGHREAACSPRIRRTRRRSSIWPARRRTRATRR